MNKSAHQTTPSQQNYRIFGLIGVNLRPLSAAMHNAAFKSLNLPYVYKNFDTLGLAETIQLMRVTEIGGLSVTIPYKEEVIKLIDDLAPEAKRIQAVNTVIKEGQQLIGYNTDVYGFSAALPKVDYQRCLILGAGGAARAVIYALAERPSPQIVVATRNPNSALSLKNIADVKIISLEELVNYRDFDLLVNTTPRDNKLTEIFPFETILSQDVTVFDLNPGDTNFTVFASAHNFQNIRGETMLLKQAEAQFELFTGVKSPSGEMHTALMSIV